MRPNSLRDLSLVLFALLVTFVDRADAQPDVRDISPRGLRIASTTTLTISGGQLSSGIRLISNLPIAAQQVVEGATAEQVKVQVSLRGDLLPGIYAFRLVDAKGISEPFMLGVDRLAQSPFLERIESTPIALSGTIAGETKLATTFRGQLGDELSIDLESRRLGGTMKPVVRLLDASGKQISYSGAREALEGDARLTAVLPADGEYRVEFHDSLFRAPASPFRLKIGRLLFADVVFPPLANANTDIELEFFSGGKSWGLKSPYHVGATHPLISATWRPDWVTGVTPAVGISDIRQFVEPKAHDPNAPVEAGAAPVGISGVLLASQEIDRYLVSVTAGVKHRFELRGARLRSPIDGQIVVRNEQGAELARADDQPGTSDPAVEVDVPAGVTRLIVEVRDTQGGGGEGFVYHLDASALSAPQVVLTSAIDRIAVPRGGLQVVPVNIARRNFKGGLAFSLGSLPAGIQVATAEAPADSQIALIAFSAAGDANGAGVSRLIGKSNVAEVPLSGEVRHSNDRSTAMQHQPELRRDFAFAATDASPLALTWQQANLDLLGDPKAIRCQLQVAKSAGLTGKTRIRVITSQVQPKKTIKENNQDKVVDDVEKTLRLEGETTFAADASAVSVTLRVPADLPANSWQVAFIAEVLSADEKTVIASAPCLPQIMKFSN